MQSCYRHRGCSSPRFRVQLLQFVAAGAGGISSGRRWRVRSQGECMLYGRCSMEDAMVEPRYIPGRSKLVTQTLVSRSPQLLRCACAQKWRTRPRVSTAKGCAAAASAALRNPRARRHTAWVSGHERRCHSSASTAAQPSHTTSAVSSSAEQPRISWLGLGLGLGIGY